MLRITFHAAGQRRAQALAGTVAFGAALGVVSLGSAPGAAQTHDAAKRVAAATRAPSPVPTVSLPPYAKPRVAGGQPTPFPALTLAPLTGATSLPYPAYGTPAPGINAGTPAPGVPATITLPQAILIAFARSPLLSIARADVAVQAAQVRLQRAGLLPQFTLTASLDRTHSQDGTRFSTGATTATGGTGTGSGGTGTGTGSGSGGTGTGSGGTGTGTGGTGSGVVTTTGVTSNGVSAYTAQFAGSLSQLIFDGGRIAASVAAARSAEASAVDNYQRQMQTVAFNVATNYYNYLSAERLVQVDLELVRNDVVQENLVRAQVAAGTEARAQIATTQLPTAQARLAVVRAQGSELQSEAAFANAMGLDANVRVQPIDDAPIFTNTPVSTVAPVAYDVALARALALRPDYDAEVQLVRQSQSLVRAASLGLFPTLSGTAQASDASTNQSLGAFRNSNQVGVNLTIPILNGGSTTANTAVARANLQIAQGNLTNTGLTVSLNIKQALTGLVTARAAFDQTQQEVATALSNVQSTQAQYRAGVTTLPLLLNAQVQLTQALNDQVTTVYTLRQAEQTFLYDVGANYDPTGGARPIAAAYPALSNASPAPSTGHGRKRVRGRA